MNRREKGDGKMRGADRREGGDGHESNRSQYILMCVGKLMIREKQAKDERVVFCVSVCHNINVM